MLLNKKIEITIFEVNNTTFEALGHLSEYTSLLWSDAFIGSAEFELWAPITESNAELIKKDRIIWCGGESAAIIEIIKQDVNDDGSKQFNVKGRTLEKYLTKRIVWGTYMYVYTNPDRDPNIVRKRVSTIMYDLVARDCTNPSNVNRKIPHLVCAADKKIGKEVTSYQKTGGEVYEALTELATESDIGFSIIFDPKNKQMVFEVREGVDKTQNNSAGNDPVVFSTELEDILSSSYYLNVEDVKNVALVQGEGEGASRKNVVTGDNSSTGFDRLELYVDARDVQSEVYDDNNNSTQVTPEEYEAMLMQRGYEKLAEYVKVETFEANIRQFGDAQYEFGKDYVKGDKVTVIDWELGISVSARITQVEEEFDDEYSLILTFGYSYPTLLQKVKRMM